MQRDAASPSTRYLSPAPHRTVLGSRQPPPSAAMVKKKWYVSDVFANPESDDRVRQMDWIPVYYSVEYVTCVDGDNNMISLTI